MSLAAKGVALCLGPDADAALAQVVQALAAGNAVVVIAPGARKATAQLRGAKPPIVAFDGQIAADALSTLAFDCVASVGGDLRAIRAALSHRDGAIIPLITKRQVSCDSWRKYLNR